MTGIFPRFDSALCCVCRRPVRGFGYQPPRFKKKPVACCCSLECLDIAERTYGMNQDEFGKLDGDAAVEGGNAGGQYLDEIGKTDLASLTPEEWAEFCRRLVGGYRVSLKAKLDSAEPPF